MQIAGRLQRRKTFQREGQVVEGRDDDRDVRLGHGLEGEPARGLLDIALFNLDQVEGLDLHPADLAFANAQLGGG